VRFETSTSVSPDDIAKIEKQLRQAAKDTKNDKFFPESERIEIVNDPKYPSVEDLAAKASAQIEPMGDPTICAAAYAAATALCSGNPLCLALAAAAYELCKKS
jgi:hypothetical protein